MELKFVGAAKTVTGSCYLLELAKTRIMVDCGMFQGIRELRALNYSDFPFDPREIDFLLLTHAHIDHSGLVPRLCKEGFKGQIVSTAATRDLCGIMLPDSGHIQELEAEWRGRKGERVGEPHIGPLYTADDAEKSLKFFNPVPLDKVIELNDEASVRFREAGHILGSSIIELWVRSGGSRRKIVFSGDLGCVNQPVIRDPAFVADADVLLVESTYGNRVHEDRLTRIAKLRDTVNRTMERGGNLVIPAFAVARTQDVLYELSRLMEKGEVPPLRVYIDSPLAVAATEIFERHKESYDVEMRELIDAGRDPFDFPGLTFIRSTEESRALNEIKSGAIIISASGMCDFGRIKHHLKHNLWRPESTILFVGFQARGTLGRRLQEGEKLVKIFNEEVAVKAEIVSIDGFSSHADKEALLYWVKNFRSLPEKIFVVHGEEEASNEFASTLRETLGAWTYVPDRGDVIDIETGKIISEARATDTAQQQAELLASEKELQDILGALARRMREWKTGRDVKSLSETNRKLRELIRSARDLIYEVGSR
ncbi:MAG TPA: MBL fold metallo-hydrolase [Firmicutes bacterium]|nr:MBL fold metallo-hydrolase [Bacillota bacterium]